MAKTDNRCPAGGDLAEELDRWLARSPGAALAELERECLERLLSDLFGYYLVQIGCAGLQAGPLQASRIRQQFIVTAQTLDGVLCPRIQADPARLPIAGDSVDVALLPHTLDFSAEPMQVLREVERILIPQGRVILVGFNPWSFWGVWRGLFTRRRSVPWCGHFVSPPRVQDWLSVLGFDIEVLENLMFRPPLRQTGLLDRLQFLETAGRRFWPLLSAVYVIQAVKRVSTLTPIAPRWKLRERIIAGSVIEPTARRSQHD
jgi:SAM-dependent methyltransferase